MIKIYYLIISVIFLWWGFSGSYHCGEYAGQEIQYSYFNFVSNDRIQADLKIDFPRITTENKIWIKGDIKDYVQLHQYTGGFFNPLCGEEFGWVFIFNLIGFYIFLPIFFYFIKNDYDQL